jgi:hypothetical protein
MEVAMVTDGQVKELWRLLGQGKQLAFSARMTQMDEKTARDYRDDNRLPSQRKTARLYRTRIDPFGDIWIEVERRLEAEPRLQAKTIFDWLQQAYPGKYLDSMRRTFERRVSKWRALRGPGKTVFFPQDHQPGRLAASDFTNCNELGVKIAGTKFDHLLFHCVLTYSNVESVSLCFSESFEALSQGIQNAFWEFGGVPQRHRTDSLSAAVLNHSSRKTHTERYSALMDHYRSIPERTNARCANENGDVESSNRHIKDRIEQALLLRGSREFASRDDYISFAKELVDRANANRRDRFSEEQSKLGKLPDYRLDTDDLVRGLRVSGSCTIQVRTNTYSVPSRLIGREVDVRIAAEQIVVTHQDHPVQTMKRLFGKNLTNINFRHVIDSLVRKPGAFANYRYREEMFPTSRFRIVYDMLHDAHTESVADKKYLQILELAARESLEAVVDALRLQIASGNAIDVDRIVALVQDAASIPAATDIEVEPPNLDDFDSLLHTFDKESPCDDKQESLKVSGDNQGDDRSDSAIDRTVSRASLAEFSGTLPRKSDSGSDRGPEPSGLSLGVDDAGVPSPTRGARQSLVDSIETPVRQELGLISVRSTSDACDASNGNASGRIILGPPGERFDLWQTWFGQESCLVCLGGTTRATGSEHDVYNLQLVGTAVVDRQAGLATAEVDQTIFEHRRLDHRRPGLRSTEPRGDGGLIHVASRTLRTRECASDEQSNLQQVGPDLQGCHDNSRRHRPAGASQRDHRAECTELSSGNSQTNEIHWPTIASFTYPINFIVGNSNCR